MTYWAIITRHEQHPAGRWTLDNAIGGKVYETKADAIAAAEWAWKGTGVSWRLVTIPGAED